MNECIVRCLYVVATLSGLLGFATASAMQNEPGDFNGVPWGASIEDHKQGLALMVGDDLVANYRRTTGNNTYAGIDAWRISYRFYKGRFASATVTIVGTTNFNSMMSHLTKTYGEPDSVSPRHRIYSWEGARAGVMTSCDISISCYIEFFGKEMRNLEATEQGEAPSRIKQDD